MGIENNWQKPPVQETTPVDEQEIENMLDLVKGKIKSGRLDLKRLENLCIQDEEPVERKSEGGHTVVELGGEIISIKVSGKSLYKGMQVETVGDSKGFVNGELKPGEMVTIIGFTDPEKDTLCVKVAHQNGSASLKLKEVK